MIGTKNEGPSECDIGDPRRVARYLKKVPKGLRFLK